MIGFDRRQCLGSETFELAPVLRSIALEEDPGQQHGIPVPFCQWRDAYRDLTDAIEKILAEATFVAQALEILMGGAHHTHIHRNGLVAPESLNFPFLEKT